MATRRHQRVAADELRAHHALDPGHFWQWNQARLQRAFHDPGEAMRHHNAKWFRGQRSQGLTEFALIAPIILLLTFGIIDFGRGLYFYITLHAPGPGCTTIRPASGNEAIKVTLWFNFQPLTPLIQQVVGNRIIITAYAVYRAEYSN